MSILYLRHIYQKQPNLLRESRSWLCESKLLASFLTSKNDCHFWDFITRYSDATIFATVPQPFATVTHPFFRFRQIFLRFRCALQWLSHFCCSYSSIFSTGNQLCLDFVRHFWDFIRHFWDFIACYSDSPIFATVTQPFLI
jgi:hypothetical protein